MNVTKGSLRTYHYIADLAMTCTEPPTPLHESDERVNLRL